MYTSVGILHYHSEPYKLVLDIDQQISKYYASMVPKHIKLNKQKYPAHISVVRKEVPINMEYWGKYEGKEIEFEYEGWIYSDHKYYWLNVYCSELEEIRKELGLTKTSWITRSPDGKRKFHSTIGNIKEIC